MGSESSVVALPTPLASNLEEARLIRRQHLNREASVRSAGTLYCVGGLAVSAIPLIGYFHNPQRTMLPHQIGIALALFVVGILQFWTGTGLRKLKPWTRTPTALLSGLGLINFPVGTLINGYVLYLVFSRQGAMVFSPEYRAVMSLTPELKYRTSILVWIFLGLLILILALLAFVAVFGK